VRRRDLLILFAGALSPLPWSILPVTARAQSPGAPASTPPVNVLEFEPLAQQRLPRAAWDYLAQGAADEITLRRNREAFDAIRLRPRVLVDVSSIDTRLELLGQRLDVPILVAPVAAQGRFHSGAEPEAARGASAAGATMVISTFASARLEDVAWAARGRAWFQLYVHRDRAITRDLVQRAESAGCTALFDGGVRHGTDIVKALALGAQAVLIGRPPMWGRAVDGAAGVRRVIDIPRDELEAAMAMCGAPSLDRITRELVWPDR